MTDYQDYPTIVHIASAFPHDNSGSHHSRSHPYHVHICSDDRAVRHSLDLHCRFDLDETATLHPKQSLGTGTSILSPAFLTACLSPVILNQRAAHGHPRSLVHPPPANALYDEMTAFVTEPPGSPPGLTGSKSSKSSSYRSSSLSGADGILSNVTNFEDIGLDGEDPRPVERNIHGMEKLTRPPVRMSATTTSGPRSNAAAMTTVRELTNESRNPEHSNSLAPPKGHTAAHSLNLPYGSGMQTGLRNSSTPSLAIKAMSNFNRSRSPSPNALSPLQKPAPTPKSPRRPGLAPVKVKEPLVRRGSWQPSKKTVEELEAEINDGDEDLPDDASLWNVPLSPRPPPERMSISRTTSPKVSPGTSPERPSPLRTSLPPSSQGPKTAPIMPTNGTLSRPFGSPLSSPRGPISLSRGSSTSTIPDHFGYPIGRTKSWNAALSELSEEAKALTETLENHAVEIERKHEEAVQNGEVPTRLSLEKLARAKSTPIELPPLRTSNVMIDPLPISKEKEKVLSRTRPSWLPPKSRKEEKKHLKEYQRMMELSLEAERRKASRMADKQCAKDDTRSALLRIWEEHVLPNWNQVIREPRTRELWWRGVAPKSRAQVWQKAIGNDLALTEVTYTKALQRAKDIEHKLANGTNGTNGEYGREIAWFDAIRRDVRVTLPNLNIFQPGGPLHDDLVDVLMAYSMYRSDVGYSHGTHLIAALLTLTLPTPSSTFLTLANLLNRPLPLAFLTGDRAATHKAYTLTLSLLQHKYPRLHSHLFGPTPSSPSSTTSSSPPTSSSSASESSSSSTTTPSLSLSPALLLEPLYRTLFLGPAPHGGLGIDIVARAWDVMAFDGDAAIVRTAVATLGALESRLYGSKEDVLAVLGWSGEKSAEGGKMGCWDVGSEEAFMKRVREAGKERGRVGAGARGV